MYTVVFGVTSVTPTLVVKITINFHTVLKHLNVSDVLIDGLYPTHAHTHFDVSVYMCMCKHIVYNRRSIPGVNFARLSRSRE